MKRGNNDGRLLLCVCLSRGGGFVTDCLRVAILAKSADVRPTIGQVLMTDEADISKERETDLLMKLMQNVSFLSFLSLYSSSLLAFLFLTRQQAALRSWVQFMSFPSWENNWITLSCHFQSNAGVQGCQDTGLICIAADGNSEEMATIVVVFSLSFFKPESIEVGCHHWATDSVISQATVDITNEPTQISKMCHSLNLDCLCTFLEIEIVDLHEPLALGFIMHALYFLQVLIRITSCSRIVHDMCEKIRKLL